MVSLFRFCPGSGLKVPGVHALTTPEPTPHTALRTGTDSGNEGTVEQADENRGLPRNVPAMVPMAAPGNSEGEIAADYRLDVAQIVQAWPTLDAKVKAAVLALIAKERS